MTFSLPPGSSSDQPTGPQSEQPGGTPPNQPGDVPSINLPPINPPQDTPTADNPPPTTPPAGETPSQSLWGQMPPGAPSGTPPAAPPPPKNNNRLWWILGLGGGGCVVLACIIGVVGVGFLSILGRQVSTVFSTIESGLTTTSVAGRPTLQIGRPTIGPSSTLPPATSGNGQVVSSSDGAIEIEVPNSWRTMDDLNAEADIQAANLILEQYAIVIREPKTTLPDGTTLDDYTQLVTQNIESTLTDANVPTPLETTVNGLDARRIEATGKIDNIEAAYIITVVEGPDHFYNITTWTLLENLDRNRPVLEQVADSFREVR